MSRRRQTDLSDNVFESETDSLLGDSSVLTPPPPDDNMGLREYLGQISVPVYILVMLFAIASWIDINGLWVELPLMVEILPEGWNLPSYLVVIIQVANIGPLAYTIAHKCCPHKVKEWPIVYLIIVVGGVACLLLSFFWDSVMFAFGAERSIPLIMLSSFLALVDCTSSVVFLPYMASFKPQYMTAFYIGEGLSGLIPGIVGLIQGVGSDPKCVNQSMTIYNETSGVNSTVWEDVAVYSPPRFSVEVFFYFLFSMLFVSAVAFSCLNFHPKCQKERVKNEKYERGSKEAVSYEKPVGGWLDSTGPGNMAMETEVENYGTTVELKDSGTKPRLSSYQYILLLAVTAWVSGLTNGVLPSTQSYSSLPYSNMVYTLSVRLATLANPLACFIALFLPTTSLLAVGVLTVLASALAAYQLYLAALSPYPPMQDEFIGEFLTVSTSVLLTGLFSYVKVTTASIFRQDGHKALLWCGAFQQVGSFCGAIITFILVNILKVFTASYDSPCS